MYFRRIFSEMTVNTYDYSGYYTIVLTEYNDDHFETVTKILEDCWSLYIANANVLAPTEDCETIHLYTFFPYTPEHCESVEPLVHDRFENGTFAYNASIFPEKMDNLFQCPLMISTYNFPPLVILEPRSNESFYIDGIEGTALRVISQRLNFTPVILLSRTNILNKISNATNITEIQRPLPRSLELVMKMNAKINTFSCDISSCFNLRWEMVMQI